MKVYFTAYGQLISMNKEDAIKTLENVIKNNGEWNLTSGKMLRRDIGENEDFIQNGKVYTVIAKFPRLVDDWDKYTEETIEDIQSRINELKGGEND